MDGPSLCLSISVIIVKAILCLVQMLVLNNIVPDVDMLKPVLWPMHKIYILCIACCVSSVQNRGLRKNMTSRKPDIWPDPIRFSGQFLSSCSAALLESDIPAWPDLDLGSIHKKYVWVWVGIGNLYKQHSSNVGFSFLHPMQGHKL